MPARPAMISAETSAAETPTEMPPRAARRTQAERRDQSDRLLVAAAIDIIDEDGVGAATFETIGQRAGYSRGLASARFGSKQGLIEAVVQYLRERADETFAISRLDDLPGLDGILTYVDIVCESLPASRENHAYFRLLSSTLADHSSLKTAFTNEHLTQQKWAEKQIVKGQADGSVRRNLNPADAAQLLGALVFGLSMQALLDPQTQAGSIRDTAGAMLRLAFGARKGGK